MSAYRNSAPRRGGRARLVVTLFATLLLFAAALSTSSSVGAIEEAGAPEAEGTFEDLGVLGSSASPNTATAEVNGINDSGVIAGHHWDSDGQYQPFRWTESDGIEDLGTLGGDWATVYDINSEGVIVGGGAVDSDGSRHAFRWTESDGMRDLGTLGGGGSFAWGVTDSGEVLGWAGDAEEESRMFRWTEAEGMRDAGPFVDEFELAEGAGANGTGTVVGYAGTEFVRGFSWTAAGGTLALESLGEVFVPWIDGYVPNDVAALGVNDAGEAVGWAGIGTEWVEPVSMAARWTSEGEAEAIDEFGVGGMAYDINNAGQIVGVDGDGIAMLLTETGELKDLGIGEATPRRINNEGVIAGTFVGEGGETRLFRWIPDSEPTDPTTTTTTEPTSTTTEASTTTTEPTTTTTEASTTTTEATTTTTTVPEPVTSVGEAFVRAAYEDYIGRAPSAAELSAGVGVVGEGASSPVLRARFSRELSESAVYVDSFLNKMYVDTLGRPGDASGLAHWRGQLLSGKRTPAQVGAYFYASAEYFRNIGGGTVESWVTDLYGKLLLRAPDSSGLAHWVNTANRKGRNAVSLPMFQSMESGGKRVDALYDRFLDRAPDAEGRRYWAKQVIRKGDLVLATNLTSSAEYLTKARIRFP